MPSFGWNVLQKIGNDYRALTRRVSSRHILLPNREVCIALKRSIREICRTDERYIVHVFAAAAEKYSRDDRTKDKGGVIADRSAMGFCRACPELEAACFRVELGQMELVESNIGYHLLLVTERLNCPKLDGRNTKLVDDGNIFGTLVPSDDVSQLYGRELGRDATIFGLSVLLAGGLLAELAAMV